MNNLHELILHRRSIRKYSEEHISPECVKIILEAALVAPSSKGKMPCQFVVIEDKNVLTELANSKDFGTKPLESCPLAVVVTSNPEISDCWVEDASIAAIFMQLQAEDCGLGSCWIQIANRLKEDGTSSEDYVRNLLSIPDEIRILCIVTFGKKDEDRKPYDPEKCKWEKIHIGKWRTEN